MLWKGLQLKTATLLVVFFLWLLKSSDQWQQLELASELESDLRDTLNWGGSDLLISMLEKLSWFHLTSLIILVILMWKWMGLFLTKIIFKDTGVDFLF